ncbi:putative MFS monocarboxylate transporter [Myriangium duriaei CBS 260.36]|uniref:MFS monocarboxylate transporter n=1 Tax=Myriangium duriaei CBS 260.36 TaxID=1168546 RepID=A0A9P4MD92_9PEZI|nr:putative MFS monocarboxylate transporter [Myriangium duriaei CBS 260.36]
MAAIIPAQTPTTGPSSLRSFGEEHELEEINRAGVLDEVGAQDAIERRQSFELPRADGGKDAWLVLFACFILEALVWGFPFAFGVFQDYYSRHPLFEQDKSSLAAIATSATGLMYLSAPLVYGCLRRYPWLRKPFAVGGYVIVLISLIGASFANTVPQLLGTQGILYGIGGSIHYFPAFLYLDEWFFARKGQAYGVVWAGGGAAGVALPLSLQWVLSHYGFRTALRTWAVVSFILTAPAIYFLKGRLPLQHASRSTKVELGFLRDPAFWIFQSGNMIQALGYFLPTYYMPSFARSVGLSPFAGTLAVSLCNGATMVGGVFVGWLVDRYPVTNVIVFCTVGTVGSVFLFWSFAVYAPVLFIFAFFYGTFASGFAATWSRITDPLKKKCPGTDTGMIIALFSAGKGIGAVISGPLSGALVKADNGQHEGLGYAWGSGYSTLILFCGITAAAQVVGWCGKRAGYVQG